MKYVKLHKIEELLFIEPQILNKKAAPSGDANFEKFKARISALEDEINILKQQQVEGKQEESNEKLLLTKKSLSLQKLRSTLEFELRKASQRGNSDEQVIAELSLSQKELLLKELIGISKHNGYKTQERVANSYERRSKNLRQYLASYAKQEVLGKKIFGDSFTLKEPRDYINIHAEFVRLNTVYRYFRDVGLDSAEYKTYEKCYKICLYIAKVIENNDFDNEVANRAYKMLALFMRADNINLKNIDKFIRNYASQYPDPIHEIFKNDIPVYLDTEGKENYNLKGWQQLIPKVGMVAIEHLKLAKAIENKNLGAVPKNKKELYAALAALNYKRYSENIQLAKLYHEYKIEESIYDLSLDLIAQIKIKSNDNIPSVIVDIGAEIDKAKKGYYLVRLPAGDLRGLILGYITDCCQSIGSAAERCVIDGMTKKNNGFYVLIKAKK